MRFLLGRVVATPGALNLLVQAKVDPGQLLLRHLAGDWGDVPAGDARENERAVKHGLRILSSYPVGEDRVWVLTEADRSATTLLRPSEY